MAAALRLSRRGLGLARPNPSVGCLIVAPSPHGPLIVGRGVTSAGGRPHAEANAIAEAGTEARGATAYVTLEPCSHIGRAAPCSDALVNAGIARVVCAHDDPDPRVAGRGFARLQEAGVSITRNVMQKEAGETMRGHLARIAFGRPHVTLKLALTSDGKLGMTGRRIAITNDRTNAIVHRWRSQADAIAVGIGTVLSDDPSLDVRLPGLASRSPLPVIFDSTLKIPLTARLVEGSRARPLTIMTGLDADREKAAMLAEKGVRFVRLPPPFLAGVGVNLDIALRELGKLGITTLFVEGGLRLAMALLSRRLVDDLVLLSGQGSLGPAAIAACKPGPLDAVLASAEFECTGEELFDGDRAAYYRCRR